MKLLIDFAKNIQIEFFRQEVKKIGPSSINPYIRGGLANIPYPPTTKISFNFIYIIMEINGGTCSITACANRVAFKCKCASPPILICDVHFSSHLKIRGLTHQYEFIPTPSIQNSMQSPPPIKSKLKNQEIQQLLDNLPAATKQSLFKTSNNSNNECTIKPPSNVFPKPEETGKFYYSENEFYDGEWENSKEHGFGKYIGACEYEGYWKDGLPHGNGSLTFKNCKYEGNWYQGHINGKGSVELCNNDKYTGEFKDSKFHGEGTYIFSDNRRAAGYFRDHFLITQEFYSTIPINYIKLLENFDKSSESSLAKRFECICNIFSVALNEIIDKNSSWNSLKLFKSNSYVLITVNFEKYEKLEEHISSSYKFSNLAGICEIQGMLFHVGGLLGEISTGNCFLMNPITLEITWLEACNRRSSPCAVNILNKVYVFACFCRWNVSRCYWEIYYDIRILTY